jgi:hypothetical protein
VACLEDHVAERPRLARKQIGNLAAHHHRDDAVGGQRAHRFGGDMPAIADHGNGVADGFHFVELVRDIHAGHTAPLQIAHDVQQNLRFRTGERRRRFVENQQLRTLVERLGDLDQLLMAAAVVHHRLRHIDAFDMQLAQQFVGALEHRGVVHAAARQRDLVAKKDVLRHRELRHQHQLLVDDHDPGALRVAHVHGLQRLPFPEDLAIPGAIRIDPGQHLHQRRFARAVLAAQADAFARRHGQIDTVQSLHAGKRFDDAVHRQQRLRHSLLPRCKARDDAVALNTQQAPSRVVPLMGRSLAAFWHAYWPIHWPTH